MFANARRNRQRPSQIRVHSRARLVRRQIYEALVKSASERVLRLLHGLRHDMNSASEMRNLQNGAVSDSLFSSCEVLSCQTEGTTVHVQVLLPYLTVIILYEQDVVIISTHTNMRILLNILRLAETVASSRVHTMPFNDTVVIL